MFFHYQRDTRYVSLYMFNGVRGPTTLVGKISKQSVFLVNVGQ